MYSISINTMFWLMETLAFRSSLTVAKVNRIPVTYKLFKTEGKKDNYNI